MLRIYQCGFLITLPSSDSAYRLINRGVQLWFLSSLFVDVVSFQSRRWNAVLLSVIQSHWQLCPHRR